MRLSYATTSWVDMMCWIFAWFWKTWSCRSTTTLQILNMFAWLVAPLACLSCWSTWSSSDEASNTTSFGFSPREFLWLLLKDCPSSATLPRKNAVTSFPFLTRVTMSTTVYSFLAITSCNALKWKVSSTSMLPKSS